MKRLKVLLNVTVGTFIIVGRHSTNPVQFLIFSTQIRSTPEGIWNGMVEWTGMVELISWVVLIGSH